MYYGKKQTDQNTFSEIISGFSRYISFPMCQCSSIWQVLENTWWDLVLHCSFRIFICTYLGKKISKFGTSNICTGLSILNPEPLRSKSETKARVLQRHPHLWKNPRLWHRQRRPQRLHLGVFLKQLTYLGWPGCFFFKLLTDDIANIGNIVILQ